MRLNSVIYVIKQNLNLEMAPLICVWAFLKRIDVPKIVLSWSLGSIEINSRLVLIYRQQG